MYRKCASGSPDTHSALRQVAEGERTGPARVDGCSWKGSKTDGEARLAKEIAAVIGPKSGITNFLWVRCPCPQNDIFSYILTAKRNNSNSLSSTCWDLREVETGAHFPNHQKCSHCLLPGASCPTTVLTLQDEAEAPHGWKVLGDRRRGGGDRHSPLECRVPVTS